MKTRSKEKLPDLFKTRSAVDPLDIALRRDTAATETEATPIETPSATRKDHVRTVISAVTVKVYVRHSARCPKRDDIHWRDCRCPKSIYVYNDGKDRRFSAKTRTWREAERIRQEIEDSLDPVKTELKKLKEAQQAKRVLISDAVQGFLSDAAVRNLAPSTLQMHELICRKQLLTWSERSSLRYLHELTTSQLTTWRSTWTVGPSTRKMRQDEAGTFFEFCVRQGWLERNPTRGLSRIKLKPVPTDYFPREEFEWLIDATYLLAGASQAQDLFGELALSRTAISAVRLRTLMLLMRWSGLRIGDAVTLERSRLVGDNILLYQAKTGEPVYVPLPPEVAESLRELPPGNTPNPRYFFWNGRCKARTAVNDWMRAFGQLFKIADIRKPDGTAKRCHSHMFRDTFAIQLLLANVPIDQVSKLLGHSSITTTERHYAPWVRARQEQLEKSVRKAHLVQGITKSARKADRAAHKRSNVANPGKKAA